MKEIKYGGKAFEMYENHYELPQTRLIEINKYVIAAEWGYNPTTLAENFAGFKRAFDNTKLADAFEYLINIEKNCLHIDKGFDPFEVMHALLIVDEKEKEKPGSMEWIQTGYLDKKIAEFRELGVTQKDFAQVNHFFFLNSFPYYNLASLKVLKLLIEYLKEWYVLENMQASLDATLNKKKEKKS